MLINDPNINVQCTKVEYSEDKEVQIEIQLKIAATVYHTHQKKRTVILKIFLLFYATTPDDDFSASECF